MVKEKSINLFGIFVQKALLIRSARRKKNNYTKLEPCVLAWRSLS